MILPRAADRAKESGEGARIVQADARRLPLADASVQCIVCSPPYWGLRDYGVADQLGLEPTPELYIASMVAVFREARRVLRDDGVMFLNIGDSYCNSGSRNNGTGLDGTRRGGVANTDGTWADAKASHGDLRHALGSVGIKHKDRIGIPHALVRALREPYYTGRIKDERDRIWLAATIEAEGCLFIHKRFAGTPNGMGYDRKSDTFSPGLEVASTDRIIVERCMSIAGVGSICQQSPEQNKRRKQTIFRWNVRSNESRRIVHELYPHLLAKQHEARILIGFPASGEKAARAHESLKCLHQGETATIDFPDPPSLFEPGWYWRDEIVWMKPNPMPESVTDRTTKAHEFIFLLTKSARYFYDADAIREPVTSTGGASFGPQTKGGVVRTADGGHGRLDDGGLVQSRRLADPSERNHPLGRNKRSVWQISTQSCPEAHFATFPIKLPELCIRAGTSERGCCPACCAPWRRVVERVRGDNASFNGSTFNRGKTAVHQLERASNGERTGAQITTHWLPSCKCPAHEPIPCTVLDNFHGAGGTAIAAEMLGRSYIGIELKREYIDISRRRIEKFRDRPKQGARRTVRVESDESLFALGVPA